MTNKKPFILTVTACCQANQLVYEVHGASQITLTVKTLFKHFRDPDHPMTLRLAVRIWDRISKNYDISDPTLEQLKAQM